MSSEEAEEETNRCGRAGTAVQLSPEDGREEEEEDQRDRQLREEEQMRDESRCRMRSLVSRGQSIVKDVTDWLAEVSRAVEDGDETCRVVGVSTSVERGTVEGKDDRKRVFVDEDGEEAEEVATGYGRRSRLKRRKRVTWLDEEEGDEEG